MGLPIQLLLKDEKDVSDVSSTNLKTDLGFDMTRMI